MTLITIEGFDRCGKDTLLKYLSNEQYFVYTQPSSDTCGVSYRDTEKFTSILNDHFKTMLAELEALKYKTIIVTRFLLSDNIYSDMFSREHLLEKLLLTNPLFVIKPFVILWKNYSEYLKRLAMLGDQQPEYSLDEFNTIQDKFKYYCNSYNGTIFYINAQTTREEVYKAFKEFENGLSD